MNWSSSQVITSDCVGLYIVNKTTCADVITGSNKKSLMCGVSSIYTFSYRIGEFTNSYTLHSTMCMAQAGIHTKLQ